MPLLVTKHVECGVSTYLLESVRELPSLASSDLSVLTELELSPLRLPLLFLNGHILSIEIKLSKSLVIVKTKPFSPRLPRSESHKIPLQLSLREGEPYFVASSLRDGIFSVTYKPLGKPPMSSTDGY
jgi:hypothetical protein